VVDGNEECDDGNTSPDDGCDGSCVVETGWDCTGQPSTCTPICGDGSVVGDELCDDGADGDPTDGCNDSCQITCSNSSTVDCNTATNIPASAFVDQDPPAGFVQCAGFENTSSNDVNLFWDSNCLGDVRTLRIRYWDTDTSPWTLLGDATLSPDTTADYGQQVFDATNHGGTYGIRMSGGVTYLMDEINGNDPNGNSIYVVSCDTPSDFYGACDLYLETNTGQRQLFSCSADGELTGNPEPCTPERELLFFQAPPGSCADPGGTFTHLAIAIYYEVTP
jgi:cysteine-rich repeat protein